MRGDTQIGCHLPLQGTTCSTPPTVAEVVEGEVASKASDVWRGVEAVGAEVCALQVGSQHHLLQGSSGGNGLAKGRQQ